MVILSYPFFVVLHKIKTPLFCNSLEKLNEMKLFSMFHMGKFWVEGKASQQSA